MVLKTEMAEPQRFVVEALNNRTFPSGERATDLAFDLKAGRLYSSIKGTVTYVGELKQRLSQLKAALQRTPDADQAWLMTLVRGRPAPDGVKLCVVR